VGLGYASSNYKELGSCRPPGATIVQAVRVVVGYIERHPQRMDEDFSLLAMEALHVTWRCKWRRAQRCETRGADDGVGVAAHDGAARAAPGRRRLGPPQWRPYEAFGSNQQIFGADEQVPGRGSERLRGVRPWHNYGNCQHGHQRSGHAATAPPSSVMKVRRFIIRSPRRRGRAPSLALRGRAPWRS